MKTLHLSIISGVAIFVIVITLISLQTQPDGYMIAQTDTIPKKNIMQNTDHTSIYNSTNSPDPNVGPFLAAAVMCPISSFNTFTNVTGYKGFSDVCEDKVHDAANYILEQGHTGYITYQIHPYATLSDVLKAQSTNITNQASFVHYTSLKGGGGEWNSTQELDGVNVSFQPEYEVLWPWSSVTVTTQISASSDAKEGSHWLILSPSICNGGPAFIFTVHNSSKVVERK